MVIDCINTATGIAYGNIFRSAEELLRQLEGGAVDPPAAEALLDALYMPRLIRHIQVMYRGMVDAGTGVYVKIGTTGTGGMGLNIPYTHSEERPSRVLLSKSALAGAQSMLLFLMARTPGAPITKEIKPAAAIAWKRIGYGPICARRHGRCAMVDARPQPARADLLDRRPGRRRRELDELYENVFIDTGENGIFSARGVRRDLPPASRWSSSRPEEIAQLHGASRSRGGNTGHDIVNALDGAVLGPDLPRGPPAPLGARADERAREASTASTASPSRCWGRRATRSSSSRRTSCASPTAA